MGLLLAIVGMFAAVTLSQTARAQEAPVKVRPNIVGGDEATITNFPYQVLVDVGQATPTPRLCGGVIVDAWWVLTAARCLYDAQGNRHTNMSDIYVFSGSADIGGATAMTSTVASAEVHPYYSFQTDQNDLALLKLTAPLPANLAISLAGAIASPPPNLLVSGWGHTSANSGTTPLTLHQVTLPVVSNRTCNAALGGAVRPSMLCAASTGGKGTCTGDTGDPAVSTETAPNHRTLVGIATFDSQLGCGAANTYSVFTSIAYFRTWIDFTIGRRELDGERDNSFSATVNGDVRAILPLFSGKILIGGGFEVVDGVPRSHFALLNYNGTLDTSFNLNLLGDFGALAQSPDGTKVYAAVIVPGGSKVIRLDSHGAVDPHFSGSVNGLVHAMVASDDGQVVVVSGRNLLRLKSDGSVDPSYQEETFPELSGIYRILDAGDGKLFAFHQWTGSQWIQWLHNQDGSRDGSSGGYGNGRPFAAALQSYDGRVVIGGDFTSIRGDIFHHNIARIDRYGLVDDQQAAFDGRSVLSTDVDNTVYALAIQPDHKIIVAGFFGTVNGISTGHVARLNPDGNLDPTFVSLVDGAYSVAITTLGTKLLVGGQNYITRLNVLGVGE